MLCYSSMVVCHTLLVLLLLHDILDDVCTSEVAKPVICVLMKHFIFRVELEVLLG